jgi:16S rRNA processing protein RimM
MTVEECYKIGYVLKPHGLKGGVSISIDAGIPNDFSTLDAIFLGEGDSLVPYFIVENSVTGNKAFVKFEDVDTIEDAEELTKKTVYLPKSARPKSERGEFYDDEIIGCSVEDQQLGELGIITDVMIAGPNRLLVMEYQEKEVLIPINSPFIISVNKSKKRVTTELPDGFLDI